MALMVFRTASLLHVVNNNMQRGCHFTCAHTRGFNLLDEGDEDGEITPA